MTSAAPDAPAIRQELTEVAVYERSLPVSLERIWENVLDWEHLPWLHRDSFASIEPEQTAPGGWRARIGIRIELRGFTHPQHQAATPPREHLARQQRRAGRLEQGRGAIEQR